LRREANAPWQIKAFPTTLRTKVTRAARKADQTMAEWLVEAVKAKLEPPAKPPTPPPPPPPQLLLPAPDPPALPVEPPPLPDIDFAALAQAIHEARALFEAAGLPPPATLAKGYATTLCEHMRRTRRKPQRRPPLLLEGPKPEPEIAVAS
jgi:hypothetical protein